MGTSRSLRSPAPSSQGHTGAAGCRGDPAMGTTCARHFTSSVCLGRAGVSRPCCRRVLSPGSGGGCLTPDVRYAGSGVAGPGWCACLLTRGHFVWGASAMAIQRDGRVVPPGVVGLAPFGVRGSPPVKCPPSVVMSLAASSGTMWEPGACVPSRGPEPVLEGTGFTRERHSLLVSRRRHQSVHGFDFWTRFSSCVLCLRWSLV